MICADCESPAAWVFDDRGALAVPYCDRHLPAFLRQRAASGGLSRARKDPSPPPLPEPEPFEPPPPLEAARPARKRKANADTADPE